ncbi:MAG: amidophosphoribosyltransferase [Bdellovibrionaceae bacterium]|nr:amidophosphoribosyltransferase [Bdellovibrio sp.]
MSFKNSWKDECGVFGIWNHPEAAQLTYLGLYAIQHRGQESAGIVSLDTSASKQLQKIYKGLGLVPDVFNETILKNLTGSAAIGHVRYATTGDNLIANAQPLSSNLLSGPVALAHNGNIVNASILREALQREGAIFQGTNDTEILLHLLARNPSKHLMTALKESLQDLTGAYSLVILAHDRLIAARDPLGFRPLVLGQIKKSMSISYVVTSETCALDLIGATYVREIEPGEILEISSEGLISTKLPTAITVSPRKSAQCVFEHVYFSRPDSVVFGKSVYNSRKMFGEQLALESPVDADIVIPVPDSGVPSAIGYSQKSGIPFEFGIIRNHYIGRTFIQPGQSVRDIGVKIKLNPQPEVLKGKRVIVIDDSLVRGTTSQNIIRLIRQAGASEVHLRIASPPTTGPCYYGVDTPQKSQLIASHQSLEDIRQFIGADTLAYLSDAGMWKALKSGPETFCAACFNGDYPTSLKGVEIKKTQEFSPTKAY